VPRLRDPRTLLIIGLLLSWIVMLLLMRSEFWTLPAPEALQRERMVRPPTMQDLLTLALRSAGEILVLILLLWPGGGYAVRLSLTAVGLILYFVATAPMALTSVEQIHRRWLAAVAVVLLVATILTLLRAAVRALRR
jgi:hypothetical protein